MPKKSLSPADLLRSKKAYVHVIRMCLDSEAHSRRAAMAASLSDAEKRLNQYQRRPETDPLRLQVVTEYTELLKTSEELEQLIEDSTVTLVFRSMPRLAYLELRKSHPPTDAEKQAFKERAQLAGLPASQQVGPRVSDETYPPALVAACLVEPAVSAEEIAGWFSGDDWNAAELQALLVAAEMACNSTALLPS